jgi:acetylornithine deacetylase/succinyl-diaminopimelate desuccinylase-like protein
MSYASRPEVVSLISDLVRIDSVTPWLVEGGAGEKDVVDYFRSYVADLPVEVEVVEIEPNRFNFLATLRGSGIGPSLCLNAHADTVGFAGWPETALVPRVEGDRLYGLGSSDDKGCCAVALLVLRYFATIGPKLHGDLIVACVADEEGISIGTEHLVGHATPDFAIVLEPHGMHEVVVEHQGFGWLDVNVFGKAAHGSAPEEGVDAIVGLAHVITRLSAFDVANFAVRPDPQNGRTVFHTGTVKGGTDYATYPSEASLGIEIGTQPGETMQNRVKEIEDIIAEVKEFMPGLTGEVVIRLNREPFVGERQTALIGAIQRAAETHLSHALDEVGLNAWTDAALMQAAGAPTIMFGPKGGNLHTVDEWVDVAEAVTSVDILVDTITQLLGSGS